MKKYDYLKILSGFNEQEYSIFYQLSTNEIQVAESIYDAMCIAVKECSGMFLKTKNEFIQWLTFCSPENECLSYFDTKLIGQIYRNKKWADDYYGDISNTEGLTTYLISSWRNKTKTLKNNLNYLQMIYLEYIRFANTDKGQDFIYGKSMDSLVRYDEINEDALSYEDKPFWESELYREQQLLKFKKNVLLKCSKNALQNVALRAIWEQTFSSGKKFNIKEAENKVWEVTGKDCISHTTLYKEIRKLRVMMFEKIYEYLDSDFEYFADIPFCLDGKVTTFKRAIKDWLLEAKIDKVYNDTGDRKADFDAYVTKVATDWAIKNGLVYSLCSDCKNVLVRVKGDSYGRTHSNWKTYFYKGGGYKDFYNGLKGSYKDFER